MSTTTLDNAKSTVLEAVHEANQIRSKAFQEARDGLEPEDVEAFKDWFTANAWANGAFQQRWERHPGAWSGHTQEEVLADRETSL